MFTFHIRLRVRMAVFRLVYCTHMQALGSRRTEPCRRCIKPLPLSCGLWPWQEG